MDLHGWKYVGRKISPEFHKSVVVFDEFFRDSFKVANRTWPAIQKDLAQILCVAPGQIRTIKSLMEEVGILRKGSLNMKEVPSISNIYTQDGKNIIDLLKTKIILQKKQKLQDTDNISKIDQVIRLLYLKAMGRVVIIDTTNRLHPLRATLKALLKYRSLDKIEWYLLNTIVKNDDNFAEEELLSEKIKLYRDGQLNISQLNIKSQALSHSYILGNYEYTGIIKKQKLDDENKMFLILPNQNMKKYIDEIR